MSSCQTCSFFGIFLFWEENLRSWKYVGKKCFSELFLITHSFKIGGNYKKYLERKITKWSEIGFPVPHRRGERAGGFPSLPPSCLPVPLSCSLGEMQHTEGCMVSNLGLWEVSTIPLLARKARAVIHFSSCLKECVNIPLCSLEAKPRH